MAIEDKKYNRIHGKDGNNKNTLKAKFDDSMHSIAVEHPDDWPELAAVIYQIGQLEEEIDYLRGLISDNKDKTTFPGLGTSGSTCLAGNTTTITTSQANAITNNTKKTGISTSQTNAITANTAKTGITKAQSKEITANTAKTGVSDEHLETMEVNTAKISFPACSTNIEDSTATITGFTHTYTAKTKANTLKISLQLVSGKGAKANYSTTLTLLQELG